MRKLIGTGLLVCAILFTACEKDEEITPTTTDHLVGSWMLTGGTTTVTATNPFFGDTTVTEDLFSTMDPCDQDDIISFIADNTMSTDAGVLKCDPTDPQVESGGSWQLTNNDASLAIIDDTDTTVVDIVSIDAANMEISATFTEVDSTIMSTMTVTSTMRLQKQ